MFRKSNTFFKKIKKKLKNVLTTTTFGVIINVSKSKTIIFCFYVEKNIHINYLKGACIIMNKIIKNMDFASFLKVMTPLFLLLTGSVLENMIF